MRGAREHRRRNQAMRLALRLGIACLALSALLVVPLRWLNPPLDMFMIEARFAAWRRHDRAYVFRHRWVDLRRISPSLALAAIAAEDQTFPFHHGFDVNAMEAAYQHDLNSRRIRGGSTISQQVAKNLFLWGGRSYLRKAIEAYFTVWMETCWPKRRILEMYLNVAEFGRGTYGAEAASRRFFHESAARLTPSQAALLAAVLPDPDRYRVDAPSPYLDRRRAWILGQMRDLGGPEFLRAHRLN
ncbi:MAG TPA: monofunctional biosynthetic peptidoglycan transglycosylase [Steroidobacteraceae bacterium]|nr:monofunctional biosynthetic peptidoglycan transglycosylase [Steroidobacteraceae bacterium]